MPITESKGSPVLLTPSLRRASAGPMASQTRAKTKSLEMLWMVNSCSASPMAKTPPVHAGHAHAEGVGRGLGQGRDVVGHLPLVQVGGSARSPPRRSPAPPRPTGGSRSRPARGRAAPAEALPSSIASPRCCRSPIGRACPSDRRREPALRSSGPLRRVVDFGQVVLGDGAGARRCRCRRWRSHTLRSFSSSGESLSMRNWLSVRDSLK